MRRTSYDAKEAIPIEADVHRVALGISDKQFASTHHGLEVAVARGRFEAGPRLVIAKIEFVSLLHVGPRAAICSAVSDRRIDRDQALGASGGG
jgi:hypothetical protein